MFPTLSEYNKTIQVHGSHAFRTLNNLFFVPARTTPIKIFSFGSGSFAVVFKAIENGKDIAVRCFIGSDNDYVERYRKIDMYLKNINESWKTNIEFLENEIEVNGKLYPVVKMDWIDGKLLDRFLNNNLHNNNLLSELQNQILKTSINLEKNKIAHGDIQCGNIIVKENNGVLELKLIDYDGMYIPAFKGEKQIERGRSEFQHPQRDSFIFNEEIDRFSFWVILCALEALKFDKTLWKEIMQGGFNTLDNLLFTANDFTNPSQSKLINRLEVLNKPSLNFYLKKLKDALHNSKIDKIDLFDESENVIDIVPPKIENVNYNKISSEYIGITISSSPSGASVRNENFEAIGTTPLVLNKLDYLNQEIKIILGTKSKSLKIDEQTKDVDIEFDKIIINKPIIENNEPIITPNIEKQKDSNGSLVVWVAILLVVMIVGLISYKNSKNDYDSDYNEELAADSTSVAVDSFAVDYNNSDYYSDVDTTTIETNEYLADSAAVPADYAYEGKSYDEYIEKLSSLNGGYIIDKIEEFRYNEYNSKWVLENTISYGELILNDLQISFKKPPSDSWKHITMSFKEFDYKMECFVLNDNYNQIILIDANFERIAFYSNPNQNNNFQNMYLYHILRKSDLVKLY